MDPITSLISGCALFVLLFSILVFTAIPIGFGLGIVSIGGAFILLGGDQALSIIPSTAYSSISGFTLSCIPLYIFMGALISRSGLGSMLYDGVYKWLSWLPGGLAATSSAACGIFAAVSGSSVATASVMSTLALPEMKRQKYDDSLATGTIAAGGTLGILIPPSIPMIIYGIATKTSIGALFIAGVIPGIILMLGFIIYEVLAAMKGAAPRSKTKFSGKVRIVALLGLIPFTILILFILGSIYAGIATPTEAAAVGVIVSIFLGFAYRKLDFSKIWQALSESTRTTAMLLMVILGAMLFGYVLTAINFPQNVVKLVTELEISRWWIFIGINIVFMILGCFLEVISIITICAPIVVPIITSLGWDPVWFGVIMTINMEMALITPPVGLNLYVVQDAAKDVSSGTIIRGVIPFIIIMCIEIALVALVPGMALWLPGQMSMK